MQFSWTGSRTQMHPSSVILYPWSIRFGSFPILVANQVLSTSHVWIISWIDDQQAPVLRTGTAGYFSSSCYVCVYVWLLYIWLSFHRYYSDYSSCVLVYSFPIFVCIYTLRNKIYLNKGCKYQLGFLENFGTLKCLLICIVPVKKIQTNYTQV